MKRVLCAFALALCIAAAPVAAENAALEAELQGVIETFLAENPGAPGISACAVCPALELDWTGATGTVARNSDEPMTPAHTFRIASNTKPYVAAAILRLAEQGRIGLDDPLSRYISPAHDSVLRAGGYDTDAITIARVMSHTAGFGDHSGDPRFIGRIMADTLHVWTADEKIRLLVEWREPVGAPGERYVYSDTGYIILGTIVEQLTGRRLGPAVRDLLDFEKLGLQATFWEYMEEPPAGAGPRANQHLGAVDVTAWHASFDLYGGGGIVADVRDLTRFMRLLMRGEVLERESSLVEMTTRGTRPYRLGLIVHECDGRLAFGHQGFWNTFAYHVPSLDLTVGGCILDHEATNGWELACRLIRAAAADGGMAKDSRENGSIR